MPSHTPVLLRETLELLAPKAGDRVLDVTLGLGGHSEAILEKIGPGGWLVGLDADGENILLAKKRLEELLQNSDRTKKCSKKQEREGTSQKSPHARKQAKISRGVSAYVERNFGEADEAGGIFQRFPTSHVSCLSYIGELIESQQTALSMLKPLTDVRPLPEILPTALSALVYEHKPLLPWYGRGA